MGAAIIISLWFAPAAQAEDEVSQKLAAGEIIVSAQEVPGTSLKRGEMMGVIDAAPEVVWQVGCLTGASILSFSPIRTVTACIIWGMARFWQMPEPGPLNKSHYLEIQQGLMSLKEWY